MFVRKRSDLTLIAKFEFLPVVPKARSSIKSIKGRAMMMHF